MSPPALCTRWRLDRAELRLDRRDHALDLRRIGQVAQDPAGAHAVRLADRVRRVGERGALAVLGGPCSRMPWTPTGTAERREPLGERARGPVPPR